MKTIKGLILAVLISSTFNALAQEKPVQKEISKEQAIEHINKNAERMKLSDAQKQAYQEIALKYFDEAQAIRAEGKEMRKQNMEKAKALRASQDEEMLELLDKYQYAEYKKIQEDRKKKMMRRRRGIK